jgi:CheY-like chemotaxis protein
LRGGSKLFKNTRLARRSGRAAADHPDVIFLDLMMPDMLGTKALARLNRDPATADIPT